MIDGKRALELFNVPTALWNAPFDTCTRRDVLENFIETRKTNPDMLKMGVGLYFSGPAGRGKTTAAVALARKIYEAGYYAPKPLPSTQAELDRIAKLTFEEQNKEAQAWQAAQGPRHGWGRCDGLTMYFSRATELRTSLRFQHDFGEWPVHELLKTVRLLIVDDLARIDFEDKYVSWLSLVVDRSNRGLVTFITSILSYDDLRQVQPLWWEQVCNVMFEVKMTGENRRETMLNKVSGALFKPDEKSSEGKSERP